MGLMLIIQFICLFLFNVLKLNDYMDPDAANLFSHMFKVVHERTYLIPDWIYTTTLELDCSLFLVAPIYAVTRSVPVSVGITNLVYALFFIYIWMKVLRKESFYSRLLFANLVLIPYQLGMLDYYNMMYFSGGQYLIKTLIPVILIAILLQSEEKEYSQREFIGLSVIFTALLFLTSLSSGIYVMMMGLAPVALVYLGIKFVKWEKIPGRIWLLAIISGLLSVTGILLNSRFEKDMVWEIIYPDVENMYEYPKRVFWGIFQLFGGVKWIDQVPVLSPEGIIMLVKIILVFAVLISAIYTLALWIKQKASLLQKMLAMMFIWGLFFQSIFLTSYASATYEYRYHLMEMIPALALLCVNLAGILPVFKNKHQLLALKILSLSILVAFAIYNYSDAFQGYNEHAVIPREIVEKCEGLGYDVVYIYTEQPYAEYGRYYSGGKDYFTCLAGGSIYARDYYKRYSDVTMEPTEISLFVFKCTELVPFEIGAEGGYFNGYYLYPVLQVGEYTILRVIPK